MQIMRTPDGSPTYYMMKTSARPFHSHTPTGVTPHSYSVSHSPSQMLRSGKGSHPTTPLASPKMPYSVGQTYPPQLSPGRMPDNASSSPSYFGLTVESPNDPRDSSVMPRENWSPPSSSVKPFAAAIPNQVPLDANPDFEAFKRQADFNRSRGIGLSMSQMPQSSPPLPSVRPKAPRWNTHGSDSMSDVAMSTKAGSSFVKEWPPSRKDADQGGLHDSRRDSESSAALSPMLSLPKLKLPRPAEGLERRTMLSKVEDRDPRLSVMGNRVDPPSPKPYAGLRSETVPPKLEKGPAMILPNQLRDMMEDEGLRILVLDVRSAQSYAQSHIRTALNLCIPTTLLKRAAFNLQKLQQTFQGSGDQEVFCRWRDADCLVVYDAFSSERTEATTAVNMIKKFTNEGYTGSTSILRGGFKLFSEEYPDLIEYPTKESPAWPPSGSQPALAPVIGGVILPMGTNTQNPFFSNIRQNMDLADGVGQMDISRPVGLQSPTLPRWLRMAAESDNHGKRVSDKFLNIEKEEQSRMKDAYSMFTGRPAPKPDSVQLCGIEQGCKNRYKDILPFEHARVKLAGQPEGGSDYVNASHIKASGSNKRYIATQGPLPATFEDFWSVIWDQDVRVIVMLTAESEGGQLKCHPYWTGRDFGPVRLKLLSEKKVSLEIDRHRSESNAGMTPSAMPSATPPSGAESGRRRANTVTSIESSTPTPQPLQGQGDTPYVIIRKFALSHAAHPFAPIREITHLHYPSWPDFGVPAQPSHLLALVELANFMQRAALPLETSTVTKKAESVPITWYDEPEAEARARPMLVHCSAGCGRTGAFCTVDSVIDMLKRQKLGRMSRATRPKQDADGDVNMDDGISPHAMTSRMSFSTASIGPSRRSSTDSSRRGSTGGPPPIDVSWLEDDTVDLIQKTVEEFRRQRLSMVQSLRQFVLCYEAILEWIWRMNERSNQSAGPRGRGRSGSLYIRRDG